MKRFLFILMAAVIVMGSTVTAFAMDYPSNLPELPEVSNSKALVYKIGNTTYAKIVTNAAIDDYMQKLTFEQYESNASKSVQMWIHVAVSMSFKEYTYILSNGIWEHQQTQDFELTQSKPHVIVSWTDDLEYIYSEYDIIEFETGALVFPVPPVPLAEEIRRVTEETMTVETMPELTRTVSVVVLCGVGCLALAISLPLLKKVLFRFLA